MLSKRQTFTHYANEKCILNGYHRWWHNVIIFLSPFIRLTAMYFHSQEMHKRLHIFIQKVTKIFGFTIFLFAKKTRKMNIRNNIQKIL